LLMDTQMNVEAMSNAVLTNWCDIIQRQIGGKHLGSKRCGHYLFYIGAMKSELGCTRRKGHGGKHRIFMRRVGKRGRKHYSWPTVKYTVAFALAE
jgi:hypothetical protein